MERFPRKLGRGAKELADLVAHQREQRVAARRVAVQVQRQKARLPAVVQRRQERLDAQQARRGAKARLELREQVWPTRGAVSLKRCRVLQHLERKS